MPYRETGNISFITLLAFTFSGQFLFKFFSISTNNFRIAASFIILKIGYDMLQARFTNTKLKNKEIKTYANDIPSLRFPFPCFADRVHCQWNYVDERYQYMDYKRDIDRNDCIDLFYHLSYIEKFHPFSLHFRQDGK